MKHIHFDVKTGGFYGAYWKNKKETNCTIIAMLGDDPEDYMARSCVKWFMKKCGVNVLTMSPGKKDYSHHNYPLERIESAIKWLKDNGNKKIGIAGASTTGTLALTAASYFNDLTLTIAMTPSDFIWQGFEQGKKDGCGEWPVDGESLFTYRGSPLPYMPFCYKHPEYWQVMKTEAKKSGNMIDSRKIFDDSEAARPITEDEFIKIENIKGKLLMIGAEDDCLWNAAKYVKRAERRLAEKPHDCHAQFITYKHGTHFVFPESLLKKIFPVGAGLLLKMMFKAAKEFPKECKETRIDIDKRASEAIKEWINK